ncbi:uncharacterized protein LOC134749488 [Cydia strobilella]|uniref:uncharacterized protein LOC134749488 n=1 Tax=Cydia strobilella TaxID=1100964 RepID=UPI003005D638
MAPMVNRTSVAGRDMKWLALFSLVAATVLQQPAPLVRTRSGYVRGRVSRDGRLVEYLGIPYGTVNDENRFKAPLPPPAWDGVFEAVNTNTRCPQTIMGTVIIGNPDCLKLNVYTPTRIRGKLLPVMVYIHGGCFFEGTGSAFLYGADYFVDHGVVFVGINYRLNVEGFLCLGTEDAPGNAGLKDQVAALRWIKDNIEAFGGNPTSVTLFGESAGAVSSSFLVLSQAARGLFHRVILQSGSTLAPWALQHDPIRTASALVKQFGYYTKDPYEIYDILRNKTVNELIKVKAFENQNYVSSDTLFVPCIEKNLPGIESIVTEYPTSIIESGHYTKLPMIIGFNDNEGIYFVAKDYGNSLKSIDPKENLHLDLEFPTELDRNSTVEIIKSHYFPPEKDELILNMVDLYSDLHFKFPSVIESDLYAKTTDKPIYFYLFKYGGYRNMAKIIVGYGATGGASHADELFYLFKPHSIPFPHQLERRMIKRMVTLWTNFAKYGDPTPTTSPLLPFRWQPGRASNPSALVIDGQLSTARLWDYATVDLWNQTYSKYRKKLYGFQNSVIRVEQGVLRGLRSISGQRRYYGIPYAVSERFQPPRDPPPWRGTFFAVNRFSACAQSVSFLTLGSEHCLHLDVYTPPATSPKLPVLVFIHGGAYYYGTKAHYDPEYLVTKNVIAVIINYRVGVLGFLCLNGVANLGLKDQVAALKWIRRNIAAFGGDPDNVTIAGQSAGASAAAMHLLSKSSDGLFHKAIFMSGTPLSPWAFNLEPLKPAFEDASKLGLVKTEQDVYNTFINATLKDLLKSTHDRSVSTRYFKYSPCMDVNFPDSFFWDAPYEVIGSESFRPIPMILGYAEVEGMLFYGLNSDRDFQEWDSKFDQRLPSLFSFCSKLEKRKIVKKLRTYYFGGKKISSKNVKGVVNYYSDWIAYASVNAFSKLMVDKSVPVYNYMFSYEGGRNFAKGLIGYKAGLRGASHSDDIFYIFKPAGLGLPVSSEDRLFMERLTTMLANFMKFGDPTPHRTPLLPVLWPLANASLNPPTLRLDSQFTVIPAPESHQGRLLLKLLCRYGQKGFVPCESEQLCGKE